MVFALSTISGPVGHAEPPGEHGEHEPSATEIKAVDGTKVVFSYGEVMPSFDGWSERERSRRYLSLDRRWKFAFDPDGAGEDVRLDPPRLRRQRLGRHRGAVLVGPEGQRRLGRLRR